MFISSDEIKPLTCHQIIITFTVENERVLCHVTGIY